MAEYLSVLSTFEGSTLNGPPPAPWGDGDNVSAVVVATPNDPDGVAAYEGSKQLECALLAPGATDLELQTSHIGIRNLYNDEFLLDTRIRYGSTYPFAWSGGGSGMHALEFYDGSGGGSSWLMGHNTSDEEGVHFSIYSDGVTVLDGVYFALTGSARRTWHRVRYYYNRATGLYKMWWDNTLLGSWTHNNGYKWDDFTPLANFPGTSAVYPAYAYCDDFHLYTDKANAPSGDIVAVPVISGSMAAGNPVAAVGSPSGGGSIVPKLMHAYRMRQACG